MEKPKKNQTKENNAIAASLYLQPILIRVSKIALIIGLISIITSCKENLRKDLIDNIDAKCQNSNANCKISFKDVTWFKWKRMYIFGSWTTSEKISDRIHMTYSGGDVPDNYTRLLFIYDNDVVYEEDEIQLDYSQSNIIFHEIIDHIANTKIDYFTPTDAIFNVVKEKKKCYNCFLYSIEPLTEK